MLTEDSVEPLVLWESLTKFLRKTFDGPRKSLLRVGRIEAEEGYFYVYYYYSTTGDGPSWRRSKERPNEVRRLVIEYTPLFGERKVDAATYQSIHGPFDTDHHHGPNYQRDGRVRGAKDWKVLRSEFVGLVGKDPVTHRATLAGMLDNPGF